LPTANPLQDLFDFVQVPFTAHDKLQLEVWRGIDEPLDHLEIQALPLVHLNKSTAGPVVRVELLSFGDKLARSSLSG
jgi:hypothetical protein